MTKRVQLVRHDNAGAQLFLGKEGECTVNVGNKSLHVHDGINQGGTELARKDLVNVAVASSANAGKMSAQQAAELAQALLDIDANNTNLSDVKADKVVGATTNNVAKLDINGNLVDAGYSFSGLNEDVTFDLALLNGKSFTSADDKIDNFPAGTKMLFQQTNAPTGWTKDITHNDKALRIVSGTAGSGGVTPFTSTLNTTFATNGHVLTIDQVPAHNHDVTIPGYGGTTASVLGLWKAINSVGNRTFTTTSKGGGGSHSHDVVMNIQYVDTIIASKD